ncbi:MAG: hypothetical protein ACI4I7_00335 [Oscillospiraceae bacterium]
MSVVLIGVTVALSYLVIYFKEFLGKASGIITLVLWIITAVIIVILLPVYYKSTRITITDTEITKYTFFITYKYQYMSMDSVTSVTTLITPLSGLTGLNLIIVNALGARMFLFFINKKDCIKVTDFFNDIISGRKNP